MRPRGELESGGEWSGRLCTGGGATVSILLLLELCEHLEGGGTFSSIQLPNLNKMTW